ncbi:MAG: hypothetical protein IPI87_12510 [Betaproteobacteria bacterium]|nr:hypothetical protein [Betaproteobacteria bacterium]
MRRRSAAALAAAILVATLPVPASGCGYHVGLAAGLTTAHASSVPVAVAVHAAVGAGRLSPLADAPPPLALVRANGAMRTFSDALASQSAGLPAVALVLVEAHLWGRIVPASAGTRFEAHAVGPVGGDVIVVTGEPALRALLDGRISWNAAVAAGLVVVDGPPGDRERIARALAEQFS